MLVTVICLCYNQEKFVEEAIQSVLKQTHKNVELIVVDDSSTDQSKSKIKLLQEANNFEFINLNRNAGNCTAFNIALRKASGDYIIDLAADDVLFPERIEAGLKTFQKSKIGVEFCNVTHITEEGNFKSLHFPDHKHVPQGDVYCRLIREAFISPPGMMIKKEVFEKLGGYDETLHFEDFDFWVRSSRDFNYAYTPLNLVKKREVKQSLSAHQLKSKTPHQTSVLKVCQKIQKLNRNGAENRALIYRSLYEIKQCVRQRNWRLIPAFLRIIASANPMKTPSLLREKT
ncbi:MAG: glycosyltransferase [Bacteroidota bacterium]